MKDSYIPQLILRVCDICLYSWVWDGDHLALIYTIYSMATNATNLTALGDQNQVIWLQELDAAYTVTETKTYMCSDKNGTRMWVFSRRWLPNHKRNMWLLTISQLHPYHAWTMRSPGLKATQHHDLSGFLHDLDKKSSILRTLNVVCAGFDKFPGPQLINTIYAIHYEPLPGG